MFPVYSVTHVPGLYPVLHSVGLLVSRFIDTVAFVANATASSSRSDNDTMSMYIVEEERQRN